MCACDSCRAWGVAALLKPTIKHVLCLGLQGYPCTHHVLIQCAPEGLAKAAGQGSRQPGRRCDDGQHGVTGHRTQHMVRMHHNITSYHSGDANPLHNDNAAQTWPRAHHHVDGCCCQDASFTEHLQTSRAEHPLPKGECPVSPPCITAHCWGTTAGTAGQLCHPSRPDLTCQLATQWSQHSTSSPSM